jgi:uncharacterized protein
MGDRVLITGVTGFVGSALAAELAEAGCEVVGLSRDPARAKESVPALLDAYAWNGVDPPDRAAFEGVTAIVHLAGEPVAGLWTAGRRKRIESSRTVGTRVLVDAIAARSSRPKVLVSASAIGYYGEPPGDREITEDHPRGGGFLADVCAAWEHAAQRATSLGLRVVCVRIGLVFGREGGSLAAMLPAFKAGAGGPIGSGKQIWPWVHVRDVTGILRRAIEDQRFSGVYNATAPNPAPQREIAKKIGEILRRPSFMPAPAFALRTLLGDFASEMLASRRVIPKRTLEAGYEFLFPELEPALRDLLER